MTDKITGDRLLSFAQIAFDAEITSALPPEKRYLAAMIARAMTIAAREIRDPGDDSVWTLLDRVYDDGEGNLADLARDIRSGKVSEAGQPGLRAALKRIVIGEVKVRNPDFLASRGIKG